MGRRIASSLLRCAARAAKITVARGSWFACGECEPLVVRVLFCHLPRNGFHVLRALLLCDTRLEPAEEGESAVTAPVKDAGKIGAGGEQDQKRQERHAEQCFSDWISRPNPSPAGR